MNVTEHRQLIAAELAEVQTCLPGILLSYDGQFATVRPALDKQLANGQRLAAPSIARVPVCWPCGDVNGAQALFTVPLKAGDAVLLHFSSRCIDDWLNGQDGPPGDPRQFDLSDCFATPMMRPAQGLTADTENVSLQYGPMTLKITPGGEVTIDTPAPATVRASMVTLDTPETIVTGNMTLAGYLTMGTGGSGSGARAKIRGPVEIVGGNLTTADDVIAGGKSLKTHTHGGVTPGGGTSGAPT